MIRDFLQSSKEFFQQVLKNDIPSFAASAAYFIALSLIPILMIALSILPYLPISQTIIDTFFEGLLPAPLALFKDELIREFSDNPVGLLSVTAIVLFWFAGQGMYSLIKGLNAIHHAKENRNFFLLHLIASLYTLMMMGFLGLSSLLMVFGDTISKYVTRIMDNPFIDKYYYDVKLLITLLLRCRFILILLVLTVLFQLLYTILPNCHLSFIAQIPGAIAAAVGWLLFSWGFSLYISVFNSYSIYGSLATIIVGLVWLYFCMYIFLAGAELNIYLHPRIRNYRLRRARKKAAETKPEP